jgi:hypothetical protein
MAGENFGQRYIGNISLFFIGANCYIIIAYNKVDKKVEKWQRKEHGYCIVFLAKSKLM